MKINSDFKHDLFKFLIKPIRDEDKKNNNLVERFLLGPQEIWEERIDKKRKELLELFQPDKAPAEALQYLKPIVGFTTDLNNITDNLSENDLRKLIQLAVPLWKQKGLDIGYLNITTLFTGVQTRLFNYFDFRSIIEEIFLGEEGEDEDFWLISEPGITALATIADIVGYWIFEHNFNDFSINGNVAEGVGLFNFSSFTTLSDSSFSLCLNGGFLRINNTSKYDFSNNFGFEIFVNSNLNQDRILLQKKDGTKEITINYKATTDEIEYILNDGTNNINVLFATGLDLTDSSFKHIALVIDRVKGFSRIWVNGNGGVKTDISILGDLSNNGNIQTCDTLHSNCFVGYIDNFRISSNILYDVDDSSIPVPSTTFTINRLEQLDEFVTDIRIVDDGSIDRTLLKRLLNLMRLVGERLNIIYLKFFIGFERGKGSLQTISGTSNIVDGNLIMNANSIEHTDVLNDNEFTNMVLKYRLKIIDDKTSIRFFIQDINNYYSLEIDSINKTMELFKVVTSIKTSISTTEIIDIVKNIFYTFMIFTEFDNINTTTLIKTHIDNTPILSILNDEFIKGKFGIETFNNKTEIDFIEMFQHPLDVDVLEPNIII